MLRSYSNLDCISILIIKVSLPRRFIFNRVLAPEGELLSFASPRQKLRCSARHTGGKKHPCVTSVINQVGAQFKKYEAV
jgi:hypothetical protein